MSKVRILFLGTPDFAVASLQQLIADSDHYEIVGVVTQPDRPAGRKMQLRASPVKELALVHQLPVFTPESVNTPEFLQTLAELGAESGVVVAYGQILGQKFLDSFPKGCVNLHGSLLPRWRGAAPIQRAIMAGDTETGVALQVVVKKLDAGPVIGTRKLELSEQSYATVVYTELKALGAELLHVEYMDFLRGQLIPKAQDESQVTIAPKIDKTEARIDWSLSSVKISQLVRGLSMGPQTYTTRAGQTLKILQVRADRSLHEGAEPDVPLFGESMPGRVVKVQDSSFFVECGQGVLEVIEVQPESRSRQSVEQYLRGYPLEIGEILR